MGMGVGAGEVGAGVSRGGEEGVFWVNGHRMKGWMGSVLAVDSSVCCRL